MAIAYINAHITRLKIKIGRAYFFHTFIRADKIIIHYDVIFPKFSNNGHRQAFRNYVGTYKYYT